MRRNHSKKKVKIKSFSSHKLIYETIRLVRKAFFFLLIRVIFITRQEKLETRDNFLRIFNEDRVRVISISKNQEFSINLIYISLTVSIFNQFASFM